MKLGFVKFKGLNKDFNGKIKSVTISKKRSGKFEASILVQQDSENNRKFRTDNKVVGIDLGLKEFVTCSDGKVYHGVKEEIYEINRKIKTQQKHLSRKTRGSQRYEKCKIKLNRFYEFRNNFLNHFQWNLVNQLLKENQFIAIENLNIKGMRKNRKLSSAIQNINWGSFLQKLEQKSKEYSSEVFKIDRFFPSSKMCSKCGNLKSDLKLSDRTYSCKCGFEIDRDLNASTNIRNYFLEKNKIKSEEYFDYNRGEKIRPSKLNYNFDGTFDETITENIVL